MRETLILGVAVTMAVAMAVPAGAQEAPEDAVELSRVIVQVEPHGSGPATIAAQAVAQFGGRRGFVYQHAIRGFSAELPQAAVDALRRNPQVVAVTADRVVSISEQIEPSGFDRAEADLVPREAIPTEATGCPVGETCTDVDIAIVDTGTSAHPDLNVVARTDCSSIILPGLGSCQDGQGDDGNGHGTHVAGTAAAFDNDFGVVGIAPGARIYSVKALGDDGNGYLSAIIAGVDWVTARADVIDVVNMSLSGAFSDPTFDAAIAGAVAAGITVAVAAGNDGVDAADTSPANHPDVITVSAVADADGAAGGLSGFSCRDGETDDALATFSNFGPAVDLAAPGVCIRSTYKDAGYATGSGTSAASPHVAGAAALYIAVHGRDVNDDTIIDRADADAVKAALIADGHAQGSECGFTGDTDGLAEPMLFVNGPAFGGDGTCEQQAVDPTPPSAPSALTATANGYAVDLAWSAGNDPDSGVLTHRIYRDTVPSSGELLVGTASGGATTYTDEATTPGGTYVYEVAAVNVQLGESARSNSAQATVAADPPTNAGWWSLDDGSGTEAVDATPWHRPGTLVNGPTWEPAGKIGGSLVLDGNDDRVDLDAAVLDGFEDVSFATWIQTTKTGRQALISAANSGNTNEFLVELINDTTLRFYTGWTETAGVEWTMASIADGSWHHLVVVRNGALDRVTAYRDGVSLGTYGLTQPMEPLEIEALLVGQDQDSVGGGFSAGQAVDGGLDEIRLYTRVLTQSEIDDLSLRDLTPPSAPSNLTATARGSAIDLEWAEASDPESGIASYEVWRDDGAGGAKALRATVSGTATAYRDAAVQGTRTYVYEVVARNGSDLAGPASPEASAATGAVDPGLLGWWALDDGAGSGAADWSGYGRPGTLDGDPTWTTGTIGAALSFDGTGDLVDLPAGVLDGADNVTVSLWFKTTKDGIQAFVSGANSANDAEFELIPVTATTVRFYTGEENVTYASWSVPSISDGRWHHMAVTRDGANDLATLFLDGVDYGAVAEPMQPLSIDPGGLLLGQEQDAVGGGFDTSQAFVGSMDEVRLYDRVLTRAEILELAELGEPTPDVTPPEPPLGLVASSGDGVVSLDWVDGGPDVASYAVYRSLVAGGPYGLVVSGLAVSEYVDSDVSNGLSYFYVVTAFDGVGNESGVSDEVVGLPVDVTPPEPPLGLVASSGDGVVSLDWVDGGPDVASYAVYRSLVAGGPYGLVVSGLAVSEYVDSDVSNGLSYFYVVTAFDGMGNESDVSSEVFAMPTPPPPGYSELVLKDGAMAYWRLGDLAGTLAVDAAGSHVATYKGGVSLGEPGLVASDPSAGFDGLNDYVAVRDAADINTGGPYESRTVELWFRADDASTRQILYEEGGATRGLSLYLDAGRLYAAGWNVKADDSTTPWGPAWVSTPVAADTVYHVVLVYDYAADRLEGFLNGSSFGARVGVGRLFKHGANIGIGGLSQQTRFHDGRDVAKTGYFFAGTIDEVALYPTALSQKQVVFHWSAGTSP